MKIMQRALKGSLVGVGLGVVFMSGAYVGCKTLGKAMERMYQTETHGILNDARLMSTNPFVSPNDRNDADFIYQSLK